MKLLAGGFLAILMLISAVAHIYNPTFFDKLIPDLLPKKAVNIGTAVVEFILGIGFFIPAYRVLALQGTFVLMLIFMVIHLWDWTRATPAMGSSIAAAIRVAVQVLFIYMAWIAQGYKA